MLSPLSDAVARCQARRLRQMAVRAPLPTALVVALVAVAPFALARVGEAVGSDLSAAVANRAVANAVVLGPLLAAAVGGAALAVCLPGRSALGLQVAAGPVGAVAAVLAGLLVPAIVCCVAVLPLVMSLCSAIGAQLPGGWTAGAALGCAVIAAVPVGAVVAEAALAAARGCAGRALLVAIGALAWVVAGSALGGAALGPLAAVGGALSGVGSAWLAVAAAGGTAVALGYAWVVLAAARPGGTSSSAQRGWRLVRGERSARPLAIAVLLGRRDDVRLAIVAALGFGALGVTVALIGGSPAPTPFLLGTTTALLGSVVVPLSVGGILLAGRWLWIGAPVRPLGLAFAACLAGLVGTALPVVVVGSGATVVSGVSARTVAGVAAFTVVGSAAALQAGTIVPWSGERMGDQLTSFAALAAVAVATSLTVGLCAPRLVAVGIPSVLVVALVCGASLGIGCHALGRRLGGAAT
jgi:hypothetical protein